LGLGKDAEAEKDFARSVALKPGLQDYLARQIKVLKQRLAERGPRLNQ
jgi:hypothetical protein